MSISVSFLLWLKEVKGFSHQEALKIIKRFDSFKETDLDKSLKKEFMKQESR